MTRKIAASLFIVFTFDLIINGVAYSKWCSSLCVCDIWYGLQYASCTGRHLYSVHTGAPNTIQALDLSNNSISNLNSYELAEAGLANLKYLNLSMNAISQIDLKAFDGLSELKVLDLSQNHLYYLLSDTFLPAPSLRILRLSKNNFNSHVPKLECSWLTDLFLDSCQISHVPVDTFVGLSHLRYLDLSNNLLIQLDIAIFDKLQFLGQLSIEKNPWSCDSLTHKLELYLNYKKIQYQAVCKRDSEPKKFEKIIAYDPQTKSEKYQPSITFFKKRQDSNKKTVLTTKKNILSTRPQNTTACINTPIKTHFMKVFNAMSAYWFFAIGLLTGSACGMVACYIWLTRKITCCHGYRNRRTNDTQRVSLLEDSFQFEESVCDEGRISCPGTPPPPYREVMLRPGLYRQTSAMN